MDAYGRIVKLEFKMAVTPVSNIVFNVGYGRWRWPGSFHKRGSLKSISLKSISLKLQILSSQQPGSVGEFCRSAGPDIFE